MRDFIYRYYALIVAVQGFLFFAILLLNPSRVGFYAAHYYLASWVLIVPLLLWRLKKSDRKIGTGLILYHIISIFLILLDLIIVDSVTFEIGVMGLNVINWAVFMLVLISMVKHIGLRNFLMFPFFVAILSMMVGIGYQYSLPHLYRGNILDMEKATSKWMEWRDEMYYKASRVVKLEFYLDAEDRPRVSWENGKGMKDDIYMEDLALSSPMSRIEAGIKLVTEGWFRNITFANDEEYVRFSLGSTGGGRYGTESSRSYYCLVHTAYPDCEREQKLLGKERESEDKYYKFRMEKEEEIAPCMFYFVKFKYDIVLEHDKPEPNIF